MPTPFSLGPATRRANARLLRAEYLYLLEGGMDWLQTLREIGRTRHWLRHSLNDPEFAARFEAVLPGGPPDLRHLRQKHAPPPWEPKPGQIAWLDCPNECFAVGAIGHFPNYTGCPHCGTPMIRVKAYMTVSTSYWGTKRKHHEGDDG